MTDASDFVELRRWPVRVLLRVDLAESLGPWLLARHPVAPPDAMPFTSGRGGAWAFALADGRRAVFREYRRGGWLARWVSRTYLGLEARPFRELRVAVEARRRGIPTPEVLAARAVGRGVYRGAIVTAEVSGAVPVLDALAATPEAAVRRAIGAAAGQAVGAMQRGGLVHADLNCNNLLVRRTPADAQAFVIDLDRAWLTDGPLEAGARAAGLGRLARSLNKLDPDRTLGDADVRAAFRRGYEEAAGSSCAC